jgi:D-glycero-alpha-D-manno-heptose-7-phosphate kinase
MIITKTPYRVSLFGGGTDHPRWFRDHGGRVLSFAINKYCYLTSRVLPPFFDHNFRIAYSVVETEVDFNSIKHPVVREVIRKYAPQLRLEIHHDGDLPARSGIGSSAAFTVGMIHSILVLKERQVNNVELANEAIEMECEILKENVGWQDQIACAKGGFNLISFNTDMTWSTKTCNISEKTRLEMQNRMVLVYSGINRLSSDITSGLLNNMENKTVYLKRLETLTDLANSIFEKGQDLDMIGEMLDESWHIKKASNPLAGNSELDNLYSQAKGAGALGGKVLGAGGGGFLLFWLRANERRKFLKQFKVGTTVPIEICFRGSTLVHKSV